MIVGEYVSVFVSAVVWVLKRFLNGLPERFPSDSSQRHHPLNSRVVVVPGLCESLCCHRKLQSLRFLAWAMLQEFADS